MTGTNDNGSVDKTRGSANGEGDEPADALDAADVDPVVPESAANAADETFADDDEVRELLREIAGDVRGDSSESKQLSAILYRVSDLYDADEETSPEEIYLNVRHIMRIKAQGGIER